MINEIQKFCLTEKTLVIFAILLTWLFSPAGIVKLHAIEAGPLDIGGAMRVNYVNGDYTEDDSGAPQRGGNGGNMELDTFRINLDLEKDWVIGKGEYRWYDGYNFIHTGWLGANFDENGMLQVGVNRVPFGVGAYGPANSWFFDQHYYVGLSDDMDLGLKYIRSFGNLMVDLAYYPSAEPNGQGGSEESARYGYDIVPEDAGGFPGAYEERNQLNARAIYPFEAIKTDLGVSVQWSQLDADYRAEDADAVAASVHSRTTLGPVGIMLQLTGYDFGADYHDGVLDGADRPATDDLIVMGAYDFAWPVASQGTIPSAAISYTWEPNTDWVDTITFYNDYSVILKDGAIDGKDFNDSALNVTGAAIAKGNWYIYVDYAFSNGNLFVGNEGDDYSDITSVGDFGVNGNDEWNGRFNINFGYYF
jgi:hypothetical protein